VSNGSFVDGNAMDGFRKCLADEFTSIYCFNLRGNARTSGEQRRKEKGNVFGGGTRTPIAITLLVKNVEKKQKCQIHYHDIGDYQTREQKLKIISDFGSIKSIKWQKITPNENHDWINKRDPAFITFRPINADGADRKDGIFELYSRGLETARDSWAYNFSKSKLLKNMEAMISFYNSQVSGYILAQKKSKSAEIKVDEFIDNDKTKISWSRSVKNDLSRGTKYQFNPDSIRCAGYRPFCKSNVYLDRQVNNVVGQMIKAFPQEVVAENYVICICGLGVTKAFSAIMLNIIPDVQLQANGQCFPLFTYLKNDQDSDLFDTPILGKFRKKENITDTILGDFKSTYDAKIHKEDIFYYIYGILHSPEYKSRFESDLNKMLPRIPFAQDFWAFSKAGRELAKWHLNYETVAPYKLTQHVDEMELFPKKLYRVQKMTFGKNSKEVDKTTIIYNSHITLSGIPLEAYDYVVNGRPALEWIMERYQVTRDADSGIENDPNDWSDDPQYILNLVKRIVRVSLETMKIVNGLPPLNEKK
jgi:predicted helicase